ncbi:MAG: tetratricopeptide repeat protein, partial [Sneathiella sp.]
MKQVLRAAILAVVLAFSGQPILAQDFQKGIDAYNSGDFETALQEWRPLAEQGYAKPQYNLGVLYENGKGVPQDDAEAVKWYRLAAEQGNAYSQHDLGVMYRDGDGVPQDGAEA